MPPLVSVITPCYNHAGYIRETIESVVHQTYKNIEYFVIDDGSTDNSVEIIDALKGQYNFYFERQQNKGLAHTMNKLVKMCKGKYVALIESDDVWTLDKIEKQVTFLEENPGFAVCGGNSLSINECGEILPCHSQIFQKFAVYSFKDIISFNYNIVPLTVLMRREVYEIIGTFDESIAFVDLYEWLKITQHNYAIVILPTLFGFYRVHESNVHHNLFSMYDSTMKTLDMFKEDPLYKASVKKRKLHYFPYLALAHKKEAGNILFEVIALNFNFLLGILLMPIPASLFKLLITPFKNRALVKKYAYVFDNL